MTQPGFTFEDAWREAVGDVPAVESPLAEAFTDPAVRAAWSAGEPLLLLVAPCLVQPVSHVPWGRYAGEDVPSAPALGL